MIKDERQDCLCCYNGQAHIKNIKLPPPKVSYKFSRDFNKKLARKSRKFYLTT
jgi:hypothetical protein